MSFSVEISNSSTEKRQRTSSEIPSSNMEQSHSVSAGLCFSVNYMFFFNLLKKWFTYKYILYTHFITFYFLYFIF